MNPNVKSPIMDTERINELKEYLGESRFNNLVETFLQETAQNISDLKFHLSLENTRSLKEMAHMTKGGAATLGASGLSDICRKIELHEELGLNPEQIATLVDALVDEFEFVKGFFASETH